VAYWHGRHLQSVAEEEVSKAAHDAEVAKAAEAKAKEEAKKEEE
jgi:hypothetical protein